MGRLPMNMLRTDAAISFNRCLPLLSQGKNTIYLGRCGSLLSNRNSLIGELHRVSGAYFPVSAYKSSRKKLRKDGGVPKKISKTNNIPHRNPELPDRSSISKEDTCSDVVEMFSDDLEPQSSLPSPNRSAVLQACSVTSGLVLALGLMLRQASHVAFTEGWVKLDSSSEVSFNFEPWHLELILGLVVWISTCRYTLLKMWPDFSESSEAANQQVLSALKPLDYFLVAFLPGISEELFFRGALLPLIGLNWGSALAVGALFGGLHLGSGRRYSFAIWATFVGFAYGSATIVSSSIIVPMVAHSLNNLVGGILWSQMSKSSSQGKSIDKSG